MEDVVELHNGVKMPILGIGTTHNGGYNHDTLVYALKDAGYRLVDTAKRYGTEAFVGEAVLDSGVERENFFLATKLWPTDYGAHSTPLACRGSLERLRTDYLDLYLLHWPECRGASTELDKKQCLEETWRAMELLLEADKCRAIGVSNFQEGHIDDLMETASVLPHVNQCEFHPLQNPESLISYCRESRIAFMGYCPLAKGRMLDHPAVVKIARRLEKTPAQVLIRWSVQNGVITIPKTTKRHRALENSQVLERHFVLPEEDMLLLDNLHNMCTEMKIIDVDNMAKTVNSDLPDGYKLRDAHNMFPTHGVKTIA